MSDHEKDAIMVYRYVYRLPIIDIAYMLGRSHNTVRRFLVRNALNGRYPIPDIYDYRAASILTTLNTVRIEEECIEEE